MTRTRVARALLVGAGLGMTMGIGFSGLTAMASENADPPTAQPVTEDPTTPSDTEAISADPPPPPVADESPQTVAETSVPATSAAETTAPAITIPATEPIVTAPVTSAPLTASPALAVTTPPTTSPTATSPTAAPTLSLASAPMAAATITAAVAPSAPLNYRVTGVGDGRVSLAWSTPASGIPTSGYLLSYAAAGGSWSNVSVGARTSFTLTGLRNGTKYYLYLYAANGGAKSPAATATALLPSGTPRSFRVTGVGDGRVSLAWSTPASGIPTSGYLLSYAPAGGSWSNVSVGARTSFTLTGLRNGTKYYVYLYAVSTGGKSPAATASGTPVGRPVTATVPGAPIALAAWSDYFGVEIDWYAPANGGSPITDYVIQYWDFDANFGYGGYVTFYDGVSTSTSAWIDFIGYGCDDIRVAAKNAVGTGPWSYAYDCYWG